MFKWSVIRKIFIVLGAYFLFLSIPPNLKPSWNTAPSSKPNQTITVAAATAGGTMPGNYVSRLQKACQSPRFARSAIGPAHKVRVIVTWNGVATSAHDVNCTPYV